MKRKLISFMLLLMFTVFLTACDFGNQTTTEAPTTVTTTQAPTTAAPTTVAPTTEAPTTAAPTTTAQGQYFDVVFYNGDGSVFDTQSVLQGESATNPGVPTRAATAQYTYTFSNWDQDYSNVIANMNILPVFTEALNYYTVTFYDGDGSVLDTQSIGYGMAATEPATDPVKAPDGADAYLFSDWDSDFSSVSGNLNVNPIFTTVFNRNALLQMIDMMFDPYDTEEMVDEMLLITETATEEDLYYMMNDMWGLYQELFSVRSGTELQDWYAATKTAGFDKTLFITSLYNAMITGMTNDLNYATQEVADLTLQRQEIVDETVIVQQIMIDFEDEVEDYCLNEVPGGLELDCQAYWDDLLYVIGLEMTYYYNLDQATWYNWEFEWYVYEEMLQLLDDILYNEIVVEDQTEADRLQLLLDAELANLSQEEYDLYNPLLNYFEAYQSMRYDLYDSDNYAHLEVLDSGGTEYIKYHLQNLLWGNNWDYLEDDPHYYGYAHYWFLSDQLENDYLWIEDELEWAEEDLERLTVTVGFITDLTYETNIKDLMGTVYDMLDAIFLTIDDATVDMIVNTGLDIFMQTLNFRSSIYTDINHFDGGMTKINYLSFLTPENIEWFVARFNTALLAAYGTLDQTDFDNAKVVLLGYMEDMLLAQGVDPLDIDDEISEMGLLYDKYVGYFHTVFGEFTSLLGSVDNAKATAIVDLVKEQNFEMMTDIDIAILVSQAVEIVIGDDSFDVSAVLQILADIYFDMNDSYNPSPSEILTIQADIDAYVTDTLALFTTVSGYDPNNLSLVEVENVLTLMTRVMKVGGWFDNGFSGITDPIEPYRDELYENFVWDYMDSVIQPVDAITLFQGIFGTVDNESTYYTLRSIQQYLFGFVNVRSFDDLQTWMGDIESFGFTQAEIVEYLVDYLAWYSAEFKDGTPDFLDEISWIESELAIWEGNYNDVLDLLASYDDFIETYILAFDPMYQTDAELYWQALKDGIVLNRECMWFENELRWMLDGNEVDYLQSILNNIMMYELDPTNLAIAEADYTSFLNNYGDDDYITNLITSYRPLFIDDSKYYDDVLNPLLDIIDGDDEFVYTDFLNMTNEYIEYYDWTIGNLEWYEWEIENCQEKLDRMYEDLELINIIYDLFNDYPETEDAINLVLDDLQNMVGLMPAGSFELIEQVIDFVISMQYYNGPMTVDMLPFTAADLYQFTQDLSALLKLRANTLDSTDLANLEAYILIIITEVVEDDDTIDPLDKPAEVARINDLLIKYIGFADEGMDELTIMLDALTEADIQLLLDTITAFTEGGYNIYQQVIMIAQTIEAIYDPATVDLDLIINMLLEVYFDMEYETYDLQDLIDTQDAWNLHINSIETLIATVAAYDINAIDPLNYPTLIELQQSVMYLGMMFEDPMDILSNPFSFTFDVMYLNDLIAEMFNEYNPTTVEFLEDTFIDILGLTTGDYEGLYYEMLGIGSVIRNMAKIESPLDLLKIYDGIKGLGYTNADIAGILTSGVMDLLYPELGNMIDTSWFENEIINLQSQIQQQIDGLTNIENEVLAEIANIYDVNPLIQAEAQLAATEYWQAMEFEVSYYAEYDQDLFYYSNYNEYFDWDFWNEIQYAFDDEEMSYVNYLFDLMNDEEFYMYSDILTSYEMFKNYEADAQVLRDDFDLNYYNIHTSFDEYYYLANYIYDKAYEMMYNYMEIAHYEQMILDYEYEIEEIMAMAWLPETIEAFLDEPSNVALAEQIIIILLDQIDAWAADPNLEVVNDIQMILMKGPAGLTIADLSTEIQMIGNLLSNFFGTIDTVEEGLIIDFAIAMSEAYADTQYDLTQATIMKVYFNTKITEVLPEIMDLPPALGAYLLTFDETKTEEVFNSVIEMFLLCPMDPNGDVREIINIAGIIDSAFGDASLDYETIVSPVVKVLYEIYTLKGFPPVDPVQDIIDDMIDIMDDVLYYTDIIAAYDPVHVSEAQWLIIEEFGDVLEELFETIDDFIR